MAKYKVGDRILVVMEIEEIDEKDSTFPYLAKMGPVSVWLHGCEIIGKLPEPSSSPWVKVTLNAKPDKKPDNTTEYGGFVMNKPRFKVGDKVRYRWYDEVPGTIDAIDMPTHITGMILYLVSFPSGIIGEDGEKRLQVFASEDTLHPA